MRQTTALLPRQHQVSAPILLPTLLVRLGAERLLLAKAGGGEAIGGDSGRNQGLLGSLGTTVAQRHVVFGRSALVAVPFNQHSPIWMLIEELCVGLKCRSVLRSDLIAVIVEVGVLDVLIEQLLIGERRLLRRSHHRGRTIHGYARGRFLGAPGTGCCQPVGGRVRRGPGP